MMNILPRIFRSIEKNFLTLQTKNVPMHEYRIADAGTLLTAAALPCNAAEAAKTARPSLGKAFLESIAILPSYSSPGLEMRARTDVFMRIASTLGYIPIAGNEGSIFLYAPTAELQQDMAENFHELSGLFSATFGDAACGQLRPVAQDEWNSIVGARLTRAKDYYLVTHTDWIHRFTEELGDELSKDSFATSLRHRVFAKVYHDSPICYPVIPPMKTAAWRKEREQGQYDFPILKGCTEEELYRLFYKYIFVYDQYSIAGAVEAKPGQTVVDAGAFIGDTACYFSRKVGGGGKVYAFEASPVTAEIARENMRLNGCDNVDIVPFALFDRKTTLYLDENSGSTSASTTREKEDGRKLAAIEAIRLDDFVQERGIQVDFIKADIEGAEMAMLNGAANTIERDAPTCALCVYHKEDDFWAIPEFLRARVKDYRFWFRCEAEPVVFARRG